MTDGPRGEQTPNPPKWLVNAVAGVLLIGFAATIGAGGTWLFGAFDSGDEDAAEHSTATAPSMAAIPSPSADEAAKLQADLTAIDPRLDDSKQVDRSRDMCQSILRGQAGQGSSTYSLIDLARIRYTFSEDGKLTDAQLQQIVDLVAAQPWCKQ